MRKSVCLLTFIVLMLSLVGCDTPSIFDSSHSSTVETEVENTTMNFDVSSTNINFSVPPSYDVVWMFPKRENDTSPVIYDGTPIRMSCSYDNVGSCDFDIGFRIFINGIVQKYTVEEMPGHEYEIFSFSLPQTIKKEFHILLTPNIGMIGDELEIQIVDITFPDYIVQTNNSEEGYRGIFSGFASMNTKIVFEANSPSQEKTASSFSGVKVSDVNSLIREFWDYMMEFSDWSNDDETLSHYLYTTSISEVLDAADIGETHSDFFLKPNNDQQLIINLCGLPGKYRVAFFVNHQALPVFDGCRYADVEVFNNQQTELVFHIDTTMLNEFNHCYYTVYRINDTFDAENKVMKSFTQKLNIDK